MPITREDLIEQSVQSYLRDQLFNHKNYPTDQVEILDAFPFNRFEGKLDKNYVATGFNFDDDGRAAEMGSDLVSRVYTIEFFIFGISPLWGRNLANAVKFSLEYDGVIPLYDYGQIAKPEIDRLVVNGVRAERQIIADPAPFEENIWVVSLTTEDTYYTRLI